MKFLICSVLALCIASCSRHASYSETEKFIAPAIHGNWVLIDHANNDSEQGNILIGRRKVYINLPGIHGAVAGASSLDLDTEYGFGVITIPEHRFVIRRIESDNYGMGQGMLSPSLQIDWYSDADHKQIKLWPKSLHVLAKLHQSQSLATNTKQTDNKHYHTATKDVEDQANKTNDINIDTLIDDAEQRITETLSDDQFRLQVKQEAPAFHKLAERFIALDVTQRSYRFRQLGKAVRYALFQKQLLAHHNPHAGDHLEKAASLIEEWDSFKNIVRHWDHNL